MADKAQETPVCDYEDSDYRARFWASGGRDYEDQVERIALRRLMPAEGDTLIEVGAGFGRLADEYRGYTRVVLFDYSRSLLREAQSYLGGDPRYIFVAGNWYQMPFVAGLFETIVQVRTLHHAADVPALFTQLDTIARPKASYVLEFASKRNLKAILRYASRRQSWSPFSEEPIEFVELNYDFHPRWIDRQLRAAGFSPEQMLTVSHFRLPWIKRLIPTRALVALDAAAQQSGNWWQLTPSVFVLNHASAAGSAAAPGAFFACPSCQTPLAEEDERKMPCPGCGKQWRVEDGLYDFKEPLP
ncbi:MAG: methyltransferase domain-containing protein [Candidatus Promineifilaceae bacterium]